MDQLSTLAGILERAYKGPLRSLLNDETNGYNLMEKGKFTWNGEAFMVPWHIRDDSVDAAWIAEGGALGDPGTGLVTTQLNVPAANVTKKMIITGTSLDQAKGNTFIPGLQLSMKRTAQQVLNRIDRSVFSGGPVKVFLNEHKAGAVAGVGDAWDASGDLDELGRAAVAFAAPLVCSVIRCDTLATVAADATIAQADADGDGVADACNVTGGQVTLISAAGINTAALPNGVACSLEITSVGNALPFTTRQANGLYSGFSLSNPYFGVNRTTAANRNSVGPVITCSTAGAHDRIQLTADRLAGVFVEHLRRAGDAGSKLDLVLVEPSFIQEYAGLVSQTTSFQRDPTKSVEGVDVGIKMDGNSIHGVPLRSFQRCGRGMALFANRESWKMAEVRKPDWIKYNGSILRQAFSGGAEIDGASGNFTWRGNFVNMAPNASVALVGIDFAGAA